MLRLGSLTAGLSFSQLLQASAVAGATERSGVLVFLRGGPSHQDTFDLKPQAPAEFRGQFAPIQTRVPGLDICEHLPQLAQIADRWSLVRGISHNLADHGIGTSYLLTGNRPGQTVHYPLFGSVVSHQMQGPADLPRFISIDESLGDAGFLGPEYGPLSTGEKPQYGQPFRMRGISLGDGMTIERYRTRAALTRDLDIFYRGIETLDDQVRSLDRYSQQAFELISSPRCRDALDLRQETDAESQRFGRHEFGQSLLMTARLIEAGVRCVTVSFADFDWHGANFQNARKVLPLFDQGLAALVDDLHRLGMADDVAVVAWGEFGRTPFREGRTAGSQILGRDHYPDCFSLMLAGGGIKGGFSYGETDDLGFSIAENKVHIHDVQATIMHLLGFNHEKLTFRFQGRDYRLTDVHGHVVKDILA